MFRTSLISSVVISASLETFVTLGDGDLPSSDVLALLSAISLIITLTILIDKLTAYKSRRNGVRWDGGV